MPTLPDAALLARLISNVTVQMCGTRFSPEDPVERGESLCGQMAMIRLIGERSFAVVVASDARGSRALASALFGCSEADLTQEIVDDAISELLNMVAGQISGALKLDLTLGLPRRTTLAEIIAASEAGLQEAALFRSEGKVDLWLWVFETLGAAETATAPPSKMRSLLSRRGSRKA